MVFAEDIRRVILELAEARGREHTFASEDIARAVDAKNWRVLTEQVKLVAGVLVKEGKIEAVGHSGEVSAFRKMR